MFTEAWWLQGGQRRKLILCPWPDSRNPSFSWNGPRQKVCWVLEMGGVAV